MESPPQVSQAYFYSTFITSAQVQFNYRAVMITTPRPFLPKTLRSHLPFHLFITTFALVIVPGSALWSRAEDFNFPSTPQLPTFHADSLLAPPQAVSTEFISREHLQEFAVQLNNSWYRLDGVDHSTVTDEEFPMEVDVIYRIHINSSAIKLRDSPVNGTLVNRRLTTIHRFSVNQPFVESVDSTASSIREFVDSVSNATSRPGDIYSWVGGEIWDFNLPKSRVKRLSAYCSEVEITHFNGDTEKPFRTENITWVIFYSGENEYYVYIYPAEHGSPLCSGLSGDNLFLKDHGDLSQRLSRSKSDHLVTTSYGTMHQDDMNSGKPGNVSPKFLVVSRKENQIYYDAIQKAWSNYYGTQKWSEKRTLWLQAEEAFEQLLAAYNNIGFLLLSITALVSSTIIAVVTARKASAGEFAIVLVEGLVVLLFLIVLSHALVVFSREEDFVSDYEVRQRTAHYYDNRTNNSYIRMLGHFRMREALVGKRHRVPGMLVVAEVCAVVAFVIVFSNILRLVWNRKRSPE